MQRRRGRLQPTFGLLARRGRSVRGRNVPTWPSEPRGRRTSGDATASGALVIRAFGPLTLVLDGEPVALSRRRERDCFAVLLAAEGRPVSTDRLLDEVWDVDAPTTLNPLHVAISRLRTALAPARTDRSQPSPLSSTYAGYALSVPTDAVDTWRYAASVTAALAMSEPDQALRTLEEAAALWTGDPYGECHASSVVAARTKLEELHLLAIERRASCLIDLGRADDALLLARPVLVANPLRERLAATVALAAVPDGKPGRRVAHDCAPTRAPRRSARHRSDARGRRARDPASTTGP